MLSSASTTQLVASAFGHFSVAALVILGFTLTIGVAFLVFYWGFWRLVNHTAIGGKLAHKNWKWVATADHWSFRHSKAFRRMTADQ